MTIHKIKMAQDFKGKYDFLRGMMPMRCNAPGWRLDEGVEYYAIDAGDYWWVQTMPFAVVIPKFISTEHTVKVVAEIVPALKESPKTRTEIKKQMQEGNLDSDTATDAVNNNIITADEMFNYFEHGAVPRCCGCGEDNCTARHHSPIE